MPRKSTPHDFWKHVDRSDLSGCWPWMTSVNEAGYGRVRYHQKEWKSSRLAWFLTYGDPGEMFVCHHCDNPVCCNPSHLFLGTQKDNMKDSAEKGRHPRNRTGYLPSGDQHHSKLRPEVVARGERNGAAVLTEEKVREIRRKRKEGVTLRALAGEYGVSRGAIVFITTYKTWRHVVS